MIKRILTFSILILIISTLTGCYEGYTSENGEPLKKYLEPEALKALTESPDDNIWIIDVRGESAYTSRHIPSARSFPSSSILDRLDELPKDKYLILYCETGGRAQGVIKKLEENGYTKMMNWGGYTRWKWDYASGNN